MIRLEGATLPLEARGAIPPILLGDLLRDVVGIPLQVGWTAVLADNCGIDDHGTTLRLAGADLVEVLTAVPPAGVIQLDNEWLRYSAIQTSPPGLTISARGYRETDPAPHAKGATVYFVETRPLYVFGYVPDGCSYPPDMLVQLRINGNAETPPCTFRLADTRIVPGVRLVSAEFDASRAFYQMPPPMLPGSVGLWPAGARNPGAGSGAGWMVDPTVRMGKFGQGSGVRYGTGFVGARLAQSGYTSPAMKTLPPPPPLHGTRAPSPVAAPFAGSGRVVTIRQGPLGTVTADLRGLRDTPGGRYTGTGNAPIVTPAHVVRLLLEESYGETDGTKYHAPTWERTAARQKARGLTWRLAWTGDAFEGFREAAQVCGQADLYVDEAGRWRYAFREPLAPAVATLTPRELLEDPGVTWSAGRDVVTMLEVAWGAGLQGGEFTLESPTMRERHGENHGALSLPYAATEGVARLLARYQLSRRDRPRQSAVVATAPVALGLTLRDRVWVDTALLRLYGAGRVPFEVVGLTDRGDQRVLSLLEADPVALELLLSGTLERGGVRLELPLTGSLEGGAGLLVLSLAGTIVRAGLRTLTLRGTLDLGATVLSVPLTGTVVRAGLRTLTLSGTLVTGGTFVSLALTGTIVRAGSLSLALTGTLEAAPPPTLYPDGYRVAEPGMAIPY